MSKLKVLFFKNLRCIWHQKNKNWKHENSDKNRLITVLNFLFVTSLWLNNLYSLIQFFTDLQSIGQGFKSTYIISFHETHRHATPLWCRHYQVQFTEQGRTQKLLREFLMKSRRLLLLHQSLLNVFVSLF